jgi:hypothetical protein
VLADGLIRKGVVELEVDVELDGNLEVGDGELVNGVAGHLGAAGLVAGGLASDALLVECSWQEVTLGAAQEGVLAAEAVELETAVNVNCSSDEIAPVESAHLLWDTVLGVLNWAFERWGVMPSLIMSERCKMGEVHATYSGDDTLEGGSQGYQGSKALGLHFEG